jgi:hypothetical protein
MMKSIPLLLFCLLCGPVLAAEQTVYPSASVGARWLNIPVSARLAGMGNAYASRGAEIGAINTNPACLAGLKGWQLLYTHNAWIEGLSMEHAAGGWNAGCLGTFAVNFSYLNLGKVDRVVIDDQGQAQEQGKLYPNSMAVGAAWAGDWGPLALGAGMSGLLDNEVGQNWSAGLQADLGARWLFESGWNVGLGLRNIKMDFSNATRPMSLRSGTSYAFHWERPLAASLDADWQPNDQEPPTLRAGLEWGVLKFLILRGGCILGNDRTARGPSAGIGLLVDSFELDYALFGAGDLGLSHLITLRYVGWNL